ncbi:hypothetical protein HHI36_016096 [Cryptolaemus montrouzieri]|uniref:Uncharacterized protein n=1 Tax=Cryptolaemus montrouzieri TaxID=559131 RepID=A0ABD2N924_9CUCU
MAPSEHLPGPAGNVCKYCLKNALSNLVQCTNCNRLLDIDKQCCERNSLRISECGGKVECCTDNEEFKDTLSTPMINDPNDIQLLKSRIEYLDLLLEKKDKIIVDKNQIICDKVKIIELLNLQIVLLNGKLEPRVINKNQVSLKKPSKKSLNKQTNSLVISDIDQLYKSSLSLIIIQHMRKFVG